MIERTTPGGKDEPLFVERGEIINKIQQALMMLSVLNTGAKAN